MTMSRQAGEREQERTATRTDGARQPLGVVRAGDVAPGMPTELVVVFGAEEGGRFRLAGAELTLGRSDSADLRLTDPGVAPEHVRLVRHGDEWVAVDLTGRGIHVNDASVPEYALRDGDRLRVGRSVLRLLCHGDLDARYREELFRATVVEGLTRLWTRRAFEDALACEARRTRRTGHPLAAVVLALEGLDESAVDEVVRLAGSRLKVVLQRQDRIARLGPAVIGVLLPGLGGAETAALAERLGAAVESPPLVSESGPVALRVTVRSGSLAGDESEAAFLARLGVEGGVGPLPDVLLRDEDEDEE